MADESVSARCPPQTSLYQSFHHVVVWEDLKLVLTNKNNKKLVMVEQLFFHPKTYISSPLPV